MRLYLRFLRYARPYWGLALLASLCFVASGFLGAYPVQLFKRAVDVAVGDAPGERMTFFWLALTYLLLRLALIQEAMQRLLEGRTSVVIAHRLSTVQHADQILVIEEGRIVERGRHDELLAAAGVYSRLYEEQFRGA